MAWDKPCFYALYRTKKAFRISQSNCLCEKPTNKALISYPTEKLVICKIHLMKNLPVKGFPRDFAALYDEVSMGRILYGYGHVPRI